jgi:hypothetical protein
LAREQTGATATTTTRHAIDASIAHNAHTVPTRVEYLYQPDGAGLAFLTVFDARILVDDRDVSPKVNNWAQDWLDSDGYNRARWHAESERG